MDAKAGLVTFARRGIVAVAEKVDRESRLSGVEALWKVGRNNINGSEARSSCQRIEGKAAVDLGLKLVIKVIALGSIRLSKRLLFMFARFASGGSELGRIVNTNHRSSMFRNLELIISDRLFTP